MKNNQKCPICGCEDIGKGKQRGYGSMVPIGGSIFGSEIIADICTKCGHILAMRVENPEKFKIKK
ncbi:transcription initiation factor TFIIIB [Clostridium sporogenes]|uniref:transcription initiation factor TFIIIB n=1 Tax=Clostridium sporogenes TaxID=1509 RepID=UPI0029029C36|nr:transcription initiation factor TFIIIB [Clostridium botulinum]